MPADLAAPPASAALPDRVPVLIAGGGPVGLTLAALLGRHGIATLVIEADDGYCSGSRAICVSRRSQEILGWVGADAPLVGKGLSWSGGRSYFRDAQVLHFEMPHAPTQRFAPMVNIQQFHVEQYAHEAALAQPGHADVRWGHRVIGLTQRDDGVDVEIELPGGGRRHVHAGWLAACDGGRSSVRELCGLALEGMQYEGRYVIVDIVQETQRPVERLAWFDPPSNPGSTLLMHRQPDQVWRIDYQIRDDEDAAEAVKPENVLPRVQSHLQMIGETAPWQPSWISIYNAKCLTLPDYRHGRVLFAGDAAHLVPIFGVRGLNSGLDDAANLAWKLALVARGEADAALLDTYSVERVQAARENIAYGAKSTEFMAPPHFGFKLMREAALRLALECEDVRSLINPRQSAPVSHPATPLNATPAAGRSVEAGDPAPEALLADGHLSRHFGHGFVTLAFGDATSGIEADGTTLLRIVRAPAPGALHDVHGEAWARYGAADGDVLLVRPDGYVLGRWSQPAAHDITAALAHVRRGIAAVKEPA